MSSQIQSSCDRDIYFLSFEQIIVNWNNGGKKMDHTHTSIYSYCHRELKECLVEDLQK